MDFLELAKERYSVRKMKPEKVKQEDLSKILEEARLSPTAKNMQRERLLVVNTEEGIEKMKLMDCKEINQYSDEAKEKWGNTKQYQEYEEKSKNMTKQEFENINVGLMKIFSEIGSLKHLSVEDEKVQEKIKLLQEFISQNYYTCTNEILYSLGQMYVNDERFKNNIDAEAGVGTAEFVSQAISVYFSKQS